jgi:two-component system, cell cycle sensor histidine kinase and response regulator CckA
VVMPRLSGRELATRLAATRPTVKVLYISGYTDDSIFRHGVLEGGMAFLQKPFNLKSIAQKVREVLDGVPEPASSSVGSENL